ncbi:hypothetical protein [Streptomyces sp. ATCC 21386]|uniref:hypothetical protein n=1 Tax=Streptomyces sp. ATCC 21386 TaxID=2699428 RepID=UPI002044D730|nr:hypothetical protein [Streptomyces sp. ATCC 21386]
MRASRRHRTHAWAKALGVTLTSALTITLLQGTPALGDDPDEAREKRRPKTQDVASTPVVEQDGTAATPLKHTKRYGKPLNPKATWPKAGSATVDLAGANAKKRGALSSTKAGSLPVRVGPPEGMTRSTMAAATPARAKVDVLSHAAAQKAGIDGLLLKVTRTDSRTTNGKVSVEVDYAAFAQAYGGDWAQRLRLVELPACALTTPKAVKCQTVTPLKTDNDVREQKLTADVAALPSAKAPLLAVAAGPAGGSGSYAATSLAPSASWQVAGQTGSFTWQ